jgi:hypothetical protein
MRMRYYIDTMYANECMRYYIDTMYANECMRSCFVRDVRVYEIPDNVCKR